MFHNSFRAGARILAFSLASSLLASVAFAAPVGVGSFTVPEPVGTSPLPVVDNYRAQAGVNAQGEEINKYDRTLNPIIAILSGFDDIWRLGDDAWANGGANGDGAQDYSRVKIVNPAVWAANMAYVLNVTGPARTEQAALNAYLDDRRSQGYSIIDGMGPLAQGFECGVLPKPPRRQRLPRVSLTIGPFWHNLKNLCEEHIMQLQLSRNM